jgi:RHS repeat-associated protein
MLVPNRHGSSDSYRYGFQGQEKDDEIKGEGNSLNYTFRMHDPRVGRFFAVDPKSKTYPYYSPYQFSGNRVMDAIELEGLEPKSIVKKQFSTETITVSPELDEPQEPQKLIYKKVTSEFTKPAVHLLSLVSGISESEINKVDIKNADGTKIPAYEPKEGGGAMTLPTGNPDAYQIRLTNNFFDKRKGTADYSKVFYRGKTVDYSNDTMAWLELASHEVGHIRDIQEIGNNVIKYPNGRDMR